MILGEKIELSDIIELRNEIVVAHLTDKDMDFLARLSTGEVAKAQALLCLALVGAQEIIDKIDHMESRAENAN